MKILVVHNRYRATAPSGENAVVDQEASVLSSRGHDVVLFQRHSDDIAAWSSLRRVTLPFRIIWSEESRRGVTAALTEFSPDVVHVHNTFPLVTPSVLYACRDASVPVVVTVHNYKLACASGDFFRSGQVCHDCLSGSSRSALAHGCYRGSRASTATVVLGGWMHAHAWRTLVAAYLFISGAQRDLLAPIGLPAERSFVKHNFVPPPPHRTNVTKEPLVAFVGRLDAAKGTPFLMRAWDAFRIRRPRSPLRLVVAGGGDLAGTIARWAAGHPSVRMAGHVSRNEVSSILARSRAAIVPSQWEETFGMVAVEAMAAGTAAVASAHGAFPELVSPGVDGALFPPTDLDALVDIIMDIDDNPRKWDEYGRGGRDTYRSRFSPEVNVDRLLEIYRFAVEHPIERPRGSGLIADQGRHSPSRRTSGATSTQALQRPRSRRRRDA
jgi:glycosyltransferase involved in cell wall biosynthesis